MSSQKLNLKSYQYELHGKNKIPRLTLVWSNSEETTSQVLCAISRITGPFSHDCIVDFGTVCTKYPSEQKICPN